MMTCTLFAYSTSPHVSQIYTGFSILAARGRIRLRQRLHNYVHKRLESMRALGPQDLNGLFVFLNDNKLIFYDTSDTSDVRQDALEICDAYFKRSYARTSIPECYSSRVHALGLNYELYGGNLNRYEISRFLFRRQLFKNFPKDLLTRLAELFSVSFLPTIATMCAPPVRNQDARVLFMARAWDPDGESATVSVKEKTERAQINETRARCIELLRRELGPKFYGGFSQTRYAVEKYSHLLLESPLVSGKKVYLSMLRQFPICIATTGLHGSIGWKMGEYVAFSKSIVSERLKCAVPGDFQANKNYLEFETPEMCLQKTMQLVEDVQLRERMMDDNWDYFKAYVMPDNLVWRTLNIAREA